jgi:hypothetical protein
MRKRIYLVAAVGLAAVLVTGGLVASNMGFKNNFALDAAGDNGSATGTQSIALPFNQQTNILLAADLIADINADAGGPVVASVSQFLRDSDSLDPYTGFSGNNFDIVSGEGYLVTVTSSVNYIVVGSHDPSLQLSLDAAGTNGSATGTSLFSWPYHGVAAKAEDLINEINTHAGGSVVASVSQFLRTTDALDPYTGFSGNNFDLVPGNAYYVVVTANVAGYRPQHY